MEVASVRQQKHFVLVHGVCHGAWIWYKLKPLLESAGGHRVTAVDLSASGINTKSISEIHTLEDYAEPLMKFMEALPADEVVILVGHSYGGYSLALAMETYPEKISVAVFVAALMPDTVHSPVYVAEKLNELFPARDTLDSQYSISGSPQDPRRILSIGPKYLSTRVYQQCSTEDIELAKLLIRPSPILEGALSKGKKFSAELYGSVKRAYIVCGEDKGLPADFQRWLTKNIGVEEVKEIIDADHMPMLSKPQELCEYLLEISDKYI
ncbi:hypothetical protein ACH5RR_009195 [Cinchona calisaya]|uniref:AB hydrolase-1 domain-containing protein n=1 Tax=Cinchona calisaya TaxID=153742 RepID=A0ABD3AE96_9GENT